jgi:hypothetical protein
MQLSQSRSGRRAFQSPVPDQLSDHRPILLLDPSLVILLVGS